MDIGIMTFNTEYGIRADHMARLLEDAGYESFWVPEHTHIPADRRSPYPGGGDLPRPYYHMSDPFVSLGAAAAVTTRLKLATGICLVVEHDPITLAKQVATLDMISDGRFLFGIGAGWNAEEMENHGTEFKTRFKVMRERVEAMKAIWADEQASYHGDFVNFDNIISYPKPVQQPNPPIIFGGATPLARQRVADFCDGWMPIDVLLDDLPDAIADLHRRAEIAGREPKSIDITMFAFDGADGDTILRYNDLDIDRLVLVAPRAKDAALDFVERFSEMNARVA
ncbi:MAG: LLM class F420-dependent oxidoreductase [Rhodospirillaceae bacterium]|jgi:probable F420-dependent oxidoreductase|nr:LLM class F420-dependent oxidoreductase [Rhodospirillaceae bacterium]MBT4045674.1 LLM class F420-dependent oxidoreductase [Rhodospirillaceae bacterium]MBT4688951.1 LLM class F420-dependent oxidoreductase [Rhodospirillaceae bacterium]MBT5079069.1 LLM class F420-dependent oxidoreductase [Rhodospirillaceae bacterium]MBT5526356.1 LLM class F420-dependent oxidoreductase [Rhodospirillaceae bacterium]